MKTYKELLKELNPGNYVAFDVSGMPLHLVEMLPGVPNKEPHITVMYSPNSAVPKKAIDYFMQRKSLIGQSIPVTGVDIFDSGESTPENPLGTLVLKTNSVDLNTIHNRLLSIGCKHTYPTFMQHATLCYQVPMEQAKAAVVDIQKYLESNPVNLVITGYQNSDVNEDWVKTIK